MGLQPSEFWALTRAEFIVMRNGHIERQRRAINESRYQAWHIAQWINNRNAPDMDKFLINNEKPKPKQQTDDEMIAKARLLNALFGGTEVTT